MIRPELRITQQAILSDASSITVLIFTYFGASETTRIHGKLAFQEKIAQYYT